jgi:geranylgeranyl pyrophosphate synthase
MTSAQHKSARFQSDRATVESGLSAVFADQRGPVAEAMKYAALGNGKRIRPILAIRIGRMLGGDHRQVLPAAVGVELLHAASLIVDDLPCMDDDDMRREKPTVHRAHGEATALLAAFGLVGLAGRSLYRASATRFSEEAFRYQDALLGTLDCSSLLGGQAADLGLDLELGNRRTLVVKAMKTAPLFELAAHAGVLGSGVDDAARDIICRLGRNFGLAFQLIDDWLDEELDSAELPSQQLSVVRRMLEPFDSNADEIIELVDYLNAKLSNRERQLQAPLDQREPSIGIRAA